MTDSLSDAMQALEGLKALADGPLRLAHAKNEIGESALSKIEKLDHLIVILKDKYPDTSTDSLLIAAVSLLPLIE